MSSAKHIEVRRLLEGAIRNGEYVAGEQLPAEQDLAVRYGVSYTTARRAVSDLVGADILERRGRKGTFVRQRTQERLQQTTLHVICGTYATSAAEAFMRSGIRAAQARGWNVNILRLGSGQQDLAVRALASGGPALIMLEDIRQSSSLGLALRSSRDRVVVLQPDLSDFGISTVLTDLRADIRMGLDYIRAAGHTHIAIAVQLPADERECETFWQRQTFKLIANLDPSIEIVRVDTPTGMSPMMHAYEEIGPFLRRHPDVTALFTFGDELAIGAMGACRDLRLGIPDRISLINKGNSPLLELVSPAITCISHNVEMQCEEAIAILHSRMNGGDSGDALHVILSRLIDRGSVASVPARSEYSGAAV
ncbi:MAG: substrate-binding domain-containing protein [Capsulimonadaceae bacterium]|nr:substrate-binding domain-containing protein [Capsulimonadaceae bacterium]